MMTKTMRTTTTTAAATATTAAAAATTTTKSTTINKNGWTINNSSHHRRRRRARRMLAAAGSSILTALARSSNAADGGSVDTAALVVNYEAAAGTSRRHHHRRRPAAAAGPVETGPAAETAAPVPPLDPAILARQTDVLQRLTRELVGRAAVRDEKRIGDWQVQDLSVLEACLSKIESLGAGAAVPVGIMDEIHSAVKEPEEELHKIKDLHLRIRPESHLGQSQTRRRKRGVGRIVAQEAERALHCLSTLFADVRTGVPVVPRDWQASVPRYTDAIQTFDGYFYEQQPLPAWITSTDSRPEESIARQGSTLIGGLPKSISLPGGRFVEGYYWDTYWVIRGLCVSGNFKKAEDLVDNFLAQIGAFGFIPNGTRTYYLDRSQPPMVSECVRTVYEAACSSCAPGSNRTARRLLERAIPFLFKDYAGFWMGKSGHLVDPETGLALVSDDEDGTTTTTPDSSSAASSLLTRIISGQVPAALNRYYSKCTEPRPESFVRDEEMLHGVPEGGRGKTMKHIRAGAESGWDFTSRWRRDACLTRNFEDQTSDVAFFKNIATTDILPADLNALLYRYEKNLEFFLMELGHESVGEAFGKLADQRARAMQKYMWDAERSLWRDYYVPAGAQSQVVSAATIVAFWAKVPPPAEATAAARSNSSSSGGSSLSDDEDRAENEVVLKVPRELIHGWGLTPTGIASGQQWDIPNVWPPLLHWAVSYLDGDSRRWALNDGCSMCRRSNSTTSASNASSMTFQHEVTGALKKDCTLAEHIADLLEKATTQEDIRKYSKKLGVVLAAGWVINCKKFLESLVKSGGSGACYAEKLASDLSGAAGEGGEYESQTGFGWSNGTLIEICSRYEKTLERVILHFLEHPSLVVATSK